MWKKFNEWSERNSVIIVAVLGSIEVIVLTYLRWRQLLTPCN